MRTLFLMFVQMKRTWFCSFLGDSLKFYFKLRPSCLHCVRAKFSHCLFVERNLIRSDFSHVLGNQGDRLLRLKSIK